MKNIDIPRFFSSTYEQNSPPYPKKSASHQPMTGEVFLNVLTKKKKKERKEIPENMNDLQARETLLRSLNYEQQENRCQKNTRALILITLLPPRVPGYESDSLTPLYCINSSHWYNLFLIQHNKRVSLKHKPSTHPKNV